MQAQREAPAAADEWLRDYQTFWKESLESLKRHLEA